MLKSSSDRDEFWSKLRQQLDESEKWPSLYMFKFIVPADNQKIAQVENLFNSKEAQIVMRRSSKGSYVSITAKEVMLSPEKVIQRYKEAAEIEGLMAL